METIYLDVMIGEKFYAQVKYKRCGAFKLTPEEMMDAALAKLPGLKYKREFCVYKTENALKK